MKTLVFATRNRHKIQEVNDLLCKDLSGQSVLEWKIIGLNDIQCHEDIPETSDTLEGNALQKALYVSRHYHYDCFADDTGLEIEALNGRPGVHSARYAGEGKNFDDNTRKVLEELKGSKNRNARFRTVIALVLNSEKYFFEGTAGGRIIDEKRGKGGFGYDPVFIPEGYGQTFAEMSMEEKNQISHRAQATRQLIDFLRNYQD